MRPRCSVQLMARIDRVFVGFLMQILLTKGACLVKLVCCETRLRVPTLLKFRPVMFIHVLSFAKGEVSRSWDTVIAVPYNTIVYVFFQGFSVSLFSESLSCHLSE